MQLNLLSFFLLFIFKLCVYCVYLSEIRDKRIRIVRYFKLTGSSSFGVYRLYFYSFLHFFLCLFAIATIQLYIFLNR